MKELKEHVKKISASISAFFSESKTLIRVLYFIGILIIAKLIFLAGVMVGFHKASFGRAWGEHYNENFGMGHPPLGTFNIRTTGMNNMMGYFPNSHGAAGKIIKIELPNLIVEDRENTEKMIFTDANTKIQRGREDITIDDLKVSDFIVVIGAPDNQGLIDAKLIRLIPSPEFLNK